MKDQPAFDSLEPSPENQNGEGYPTFHIRDVVDQVLDQYQKAITGQNHTLGLPTGIQQLDRMLGGLMPGLHILGSLPSMGKTTLMLNIAEHLCVDLKVPCLIFSGNLTANQIVRRIVFSRARQSPFVMHSSSNVPNESEQLQLKRSASEIAESPLYVEEAFDFSIETLRSMAARYRQTADIGFITVDHLHLLRMKSMPIELSREREVVEIVAQLKTLAREIGIPILLLTDLSRRPESRSGRQLGVPRMTDLQYCNLVQGFADTICLLYRAQFYAESEVERDTLLGKAELILCKNAAGNTGFVEFHFDSELLRFEEIGRCEHR